MDWSCGVRCVPSPVTKLAAGGGCPRLFDAACVEAAAVNAAWDEDAASEKPRHRDTRQRAMANPRHPSSGIVLISTLSNPAAWACLERGVA